VVAADMQRPVQADAEASGRQDGMPPHFPLVAPAVEPAVLLCPCTERANYVMFVTLLLKRCCEPSIAQGFDRQTARSRWTSCVARARFVWQTVTGLVAGLVRNREQESVLDPASSGFFAASMR